MAVHIPPILVVIACKVVMAASQDPNAAFTHVENTEWATENSMMVCQRNEVELYDPVEGMQLNQADDPVPALNPDFTDHGQCARAPSSATSCSNAGIATRWCARPIPRFSCRIDGAAAPPAVANNRKPL